MTVVTDFNLRQPSRPMPDLRKHRYSVITAKVNKLRYFGSTQSSLGIVLSLQPVSARMVKMGVMGQSGHKNIADYSGGVLIGNYFEEAQHRLTSSQGERLLGLGSRFAGQATTASAQNPEGRNGAELAASYARTDLTRVGKCVPHTLKFTHGDPHEPPMQCFATVNELAFGEKSMGEPPVQQYLLSGKAKLNAFVPISTPEGSNSSSTLLGNTKRSQWAASTDDNMYSTSAQGAASSAALQAAANPAACHTAKSVPASENGPAPVGRKAGGQFAAEMDKSYHAIGLRK